MPRLNGLEVWEVLRRVCPETPVIILTWQGRWATLLAAREGPYGYLEKPVEVPQLRMLVAKALAPATGYCVVGVHPEGSRARNHPRARRPFPSG